MGGFHTPLGGCGQNQTNIPVESGVGDVPPAARLQPRIDFTTGRVVDVAGRSVERYCSLDL
jgi:hypothetical protein